MTKTLKPGFYPKKDYRVKQVNYCGFHLVPGFFVDKTEDTKPIACWATFTPDKKFMGWSTQFLDAKERVKNYKISKFIKKK